jgi:hypothetical protein
MKREVDYEWETGIGVGKGRRKKGVELTRKREENPTQG